MGKTVLPKNLIAEISKLQNQGYSPIEIFDMVQEEAKKYLVSEAQLSRCITAIGREKSSQTLKPKKGQPKDLEVPLPKTFNTSNYNELIENLNEGMDGKIIEARTQKIANDILTNYENFQGLKNANIESDYPNPPFDFFGFKSGIPYMIEFKASLNHFNAPGETQKRRLKELMDNIPGLKIALLQVKLKKGEYRIF